MPSAVGIALLLCYDLVDVLFVQFMSSLQFSLLESRFTKGAQLQILLSLSTLQYSIVSPMKKSLLETNPHLQDASKREKALARNVETSSAVEGIHVKRDAVSGRFISQTIYLQAAVKSSKTSR